MSPRRRLRTRYEPVSPPAPPEPEPRERAAQEPAVPKAEATVAAPGPAAPDELPPAPRPPAPEVPPAPAPEVPPVPGPPPPAPELPPAPAPEVPPAPVPPPAPRPPERLARLGRQVRGLVTVAVFAVAAFVTGLLLFNNLVMPRLIHGGGQVEVPDLTHLTMQQAEQALRPLGLQISRAGERFDPTTPRGFVLSQDPPAGTHVRGRRRISVLVSLGEEFSSVPELFGESVRAARMLIERSGLRPGTLVQAPSEDAGQGLVIGSDPGAEAVLPRDTPVHLLVSTGPGEESYVMPDLLGREVVGVRRQLEALGFRIDLPGGGRPVGTIVSQQPTAGSRILRAAVIQLRATGRVIR